MNHSGPELQCAHQSEGSAATASMSSTRPGGWRYRAMRGAISAKSAKSVFEEMAASGKSAEAVVAESKVVVAEAKAEAGRPVGLDAPARPEPAPELKPARTGGRR